MTNADRSTTTVLLLCVCLSCVVPARAAAQTDPLGATPHATSTTFRVWAPFVDSVSVRINDQRTFPLEREPGHPMPDDTVWVAKVPAAKRGDRYLYLITLRSATRPFNDPRARQLAGYPDAPESVIVDTSQSATAFTMPPFNRLVVYELHIGSFNANALTRKYDFDGAIDKLDYLKRLGVNAVELLPVHQNTVNASHRPPDYNWGYDIAHLFAVNAAYGTPTDFKRFVRECHARGIAVILDVVYNHCATQNLLASFDGYSDPADKDGIYFYGDDREESGFGPRMDFGRPQVREHIRDNALMWLREYGVDGLRWDSVINIRAFYDRTSHRLQVSRDGERLIREANDAYRDTAPRQPWKISVAEDLRRFSGVTLPTSQDLDGYAGLGFDTQWDESLCLAVRRAVVQSDDGNRDISAVKSALELQFGRNAFHRVVYSENHDKVGHQNEMVDGKPQSRLPRIVDEADPESVFAKKISSLAAGIILTAPGIPMLFQGQEMLETRSFDFGTATPMDWNRVPRLRGIVKLYHDLIALRRNAGNKTGGLSGQHINVYHCDKQNNTLVYHRFGIGGPGDDVVVVVNLSNQAIPALAIGLPRGGVWRVRLNSGSSVYDPSFRNGDSFDVTAVPGDLDGLRFQGSSGIGPYSMVILSQDR